MTSEPDDQDEDGRHFTEDDEDAPLKVCPHCDGTGREYIIGLGSRCSQCNGSGEV